MFDIGPVGIMATVIGVFFLALNVWILRQELRSSRNKKK